MRNRLKLLLLTPHLGGGGAEHVIALLAKGLANRNHEVHLGVVTDHLNLASPDSVYTVHSLKARRVRYAAGEILRLVRSLSPDIVLSGMFHLNHLVLLLQGQFPAGTKVVLRQNGMPVSFSRTGPGPISRLIYHSLYNRAQCIVCQTDAMAIEMRSLLRPAHRLCVLPNPVDLAKIRAVCRSTYAPNMHGGTMIFLAIGRLSYEKGFDLLLEAFRRFHEEHPQALLVLLGEGPERGRLELLRGRLGMSQFVDMPGYVEDPAPWIAKAAAFVCPSRHDAMPNAMLEAAAGGLPILSTPSSAGVVSLLRNKAGAWITESATSEALATALRSAHETIERKTRFPHPWIEQHDLDLVSAQYEDLFVGNSVKAHPCNT